MPSQSEKRKKRRIDEYFGEDDPNSGLQETQEEYVSLNSFLQSSDSSLVKLFRTFKEDEEFINSQINLLKQKFEGAMEEFHTILTLSIVTVPQSVVRSVTKKRNEFFIFSY
jgi:hypothetical protein